MTKTLLKVLVGVVFIGSATAMAHDDGHGDEIRTEAPSSDTEFNLVGGFGYTYQDTQGRNRISYELYTDNTCKIYLYDTSSNYVGEQWERPEGCRKLISTLDSATASTPVSVSVNPHTMKVREILPFDGVRSESSSSSSSSN